MAEEGFKRKLTAILSADVKGYSRLMDDDEEATIRTLTDYREAMRNIIQQHRGRVVDTTGDNLLAEFTSAVDAVNCSVEIQRELSERNPELPYERRMEFRIGVNVGDVVEEEGRIYGDGVNIAARVEGLAEAGGICITGRVYDQVENKLHFEYEYKGGQAVKNISKPVRVYRVWAKSNIDIPSAETELELPDKPSIAVLPFVNMSGDPSQEYFSDGLTEQIINGISKIRNLFVIARNSTFTYKGKAVKVQQVGQELGVRYVLEGSVQKSGERVRITAQLIDAKTGHHLWSENFDRDLIDIFAIQDEITIKVIDALHVKLIEGEQWHQWEGLTNNINAFNKHLQGMEYFYRLKEGDNSQARKLFEEAIRLDSKFASPHALLAWTHLIDIYFGWSKSPIESFELAEKLAEKTLELDDSIDFAYTLLSQIYLFKRQYDRAIEEGERAVALNPNGAHAYAFLGLILHFSGRPEDAIASVKKAIRLNPIPPDFYLGFLAQAYRLTGKYEEAIKACKRALDQNPDNLIVQAILTACCSMLGNDKEARKAASEVLRIHPKFSIAYVAKTLPYKNQSDIDHYVEALSKAGLPE
ncbi:MAG: adenylate/guanylate cyclase domain-containing protein [Deltaproteobacteria bacterium]|nr:MAG: adenylate/guanylate cyclase domain-containing protein [Deltaproteobacteria bacterium]